MRPTTSLPPSTRTAGNAATRPRITDSRVGRLTHSAVSPEGPCRNRCPPKHDDRSCTGHDYGPGQAYIDAGYGHVHLGRNEGATALEIMVTYLDVPIGGAVRIDADDPGTCTF